MNNNDAVKLRITDVFYSLIKHRILIIALMMLGLMIGAALSIVSCMRGEMSRKYAITSSFAVTTVTQDGLFTTKTNNPGSTDVYLAENMVESVIYLIKSDRTLNAAVERLRLPGIVAGDIDSNLMLRQYGSTQIIEMTLYWRSAEEGMQILSAINSVVPGALVDTLKIGSVSVVNEPKARYRIGSSVNAAMWIYLAFGGMIAGVIFSILELILRSTLVNTKDVEDMLGLEIIGEIPQSMSYFGRKCMPVMNLENSRDAQVQECFTSAAHILHHYIGSEKHQCIYITSAAHGEGKTGIAANLAVRLSSLEYKVLLIDLDVHNPTLGGMFLDHVEYKHSLNALYCGETTADEAMTHLTDYLDVLPTSLEHDALPLDEEMMSLIRSLAEEYDYVLMDAAPIGCDADMMKLNCIARSALFVIRYDHTRLSDIRKALVRLKKSGIRPIGCIVNGVKKFGGYGGGSGAEWRVLTAGRRDGTGKARG